jgi:hypothetical protein
MSGERLINGTSGWTMVTLSLIVIIGGVSALVSGADGAWLLVAGIVLEMVGVFLLPGLFVTQLNQSRVVTLFGRYMGTVRENGFRWSIHWLAKSRCRFVSEPSTRMCSRSTMPWGILSRSPR